MLRSDLRRQLLKVVGAFFLAAGLPIAPALSATRPSAGARRTLAAFLDALLPRDAVSASASDLRVDAQLWALARLDRRFERLLVLGCQWLDLTGTVRFADLAASDQDKVVEWMSTSDWNQIPRRFYELVRQTAVETYYSNPAAWNGLSIKAPPQPSGYPPPWQ